MTFGRRIRMHVFIFAYLFNVVFLFCLFLLYDIFFIVEQMCTFVTEFFFFVTHFFFCLIILIFFLTFITSVFYSKRHSPLSRSDEVTLLKSTVYLFFVSFFYYY